MNKHFSHRIQNEIQKKLFNANSSIKIAVAWFTNELLFQPLLLKLKLGVHVELILNHDDINVSESSLNFDEFVRSGGVLHWNMSRQLMHDKFCIIDDDLVITGSYNWTNKAEDNDESVTFTSGENETSKFYIQRFNDLKSKYPHIHKPSTLESPKTSPIPESVVQQSVEVEEPIIDKGQCGEKAYYKLYESGLLSISGNGKMYDFNSDHRPQWYAYRKNIKKVICSAQLGTEAFAGCEELLSFKTDVGNQIIPEYAFCGCENMEMAEFANHPSVICDKAFSRCTKLDIKGSEVLQDVVEIGHGAFEQCDNLYAINADLLVDMVPCRGIRWETIWYYDDLSIPFDWEEEQMKDYKRKLHYEWSEDIDHSCKMNRVKIISDQAFAYCFNLRSIALPETLERLGSRGYPSWKSFYYCKNLKYLKFCNSYFENFDISEHFEGAKDLLFLFLPSYMQEREDVINDIKSYPICYSGDDGDCSHVPTVCYFKSEDPRIKCLNSCNPSNIETFEPIFYFDLPRFDLCKSTAGYIYGGREGQVISFMEYPYLYCRRQQGITSYWIACRTSQFGYTLLDLRVFFIKDINGEPIDDFRRAFIEKYEMYVNCEPENGEPSDRRLAFMYVYQDILAGRTVKFSSVIKYKYKTRLDTILDTYAYSIKYTECKLPEVTL